MVQLFLKYFFKKKLYKIFIYFISNRAKKEDFKKNNFNYEQKILFKKCFTFQFALANHEPLLT